MQNADVKSAYRNGVLRFVLTGEIDHHSAPLVRQKMDEDIFLYRPKVTVIVLSEMDFMDSSGLGLILGRYKKAKAVDAELILEDPTPATQKILRLAGVDRMIQIKIGDKTKESQHEKREDQ